MTVTPPSESPVVVVPLSADGLLTGAHVAQKNALVRPRNSETAFFPRIIGVGLAQMLAKEKSSMMRRLPPSGALLPVLHCLSSRVATAIPVRECEPASR